MNKNEITFLWGDRDRDYKGDWEWKKIETTRFDCYIWKKFTLEIFAKNYENFSLDLVKIDLERRKDFNRKGVIGKAWINKEWNRKNLMNKGSFPGNDCTRNYWKGKDSIRKGLDRVKGWKIRKQ